MKVIRLRKIDSELKEANYLAYCQSLTDTERIAFLEKLSADMWDIWRANPDNLHRLEKIDETKPARIQRLRKFNKHPEAH